MICRENLTKSRIRQRHRKINGVAIIAHHRSQVKTPRLGTAVVDAIMLRDSELADLKDRFLFADWSLDFRKPSDQLFTAMPNSASDASSLWSVKKNAELDTRIVALSLDTNGRVYLLTSENFGP